MWDRLGCDQPLSSAVGGVSTVRGSNSGSGGVGGVRGGGV